MTIYRCLSHDVIKWLKAKGPRAVPPHRAFSALPTGVLLSDDAEHPEAPFSDSHKDSHAGYNQPRHPCHRGFMLLLRLWRSLLHSSRQWRLKGSATHMPPPGSQPFLVMSHVHLLGQSLRLDEDVEVGLLQLLSYHGEDSGCGTELSQVVNDELEEQLKEKAFSAAKLGKHTPLQGGKAFLS